MKKELSIILSFALLLPMILVPTFAINNTASDELPPWVEEGEVWHPANGIMPIEDDGCPKSHFPPKGYVYQGYTEGNSVLDAVVQTGMVQLVGWLPGIGTVVQIIDAATTLEWLLPAIEEGRIRTTYHKYVYTNGSLYWHHYYWYYRSDTDGLYRYFACEVKTNA